MWTTQAQWGESSHGQNHSWKYLQKISSSSFHKCPTWSLWTRSRLCLCAVWSSSWWWRRRTTSSSFCCRNPPPGQVRKKSKRGGKPSKEMPWRQHAFKKTAHIYRPHPQVTRFTKTFAYSCSPTFDRDKHTRCSLQMFCTSWWQCESHKNINASNVQIIPNLNQSQRKNLSEQIYST